LAPRRSARTAHGDDLEALKSAIDPRRHAQLTTEFVDDVQIDPSRYGIPQIDSRRMSTAVKAAVEHR
jgi:hypothetical protein